MASRLRFGFIASVAVAGCLAFSTAAAQEPTLYYDFEEGTGAEVNNLGTLGGIGALSGTDGVDEGWVAGAPDGYSPGGGLHFDGVDDFIDSTLGAGPLGIDQSPDHTTVAWLKVDNLNGDNMVFGQQDGNRLHNGVRGNKFHFGHWGNDTAGTQVVEADRWYHAAFVYRGGLQIIIIDGEGDALGVKGQLNNAGNVLIGKTENRWFTGTVDDVLVYDEALELNQIRHLRDGGDPADLPEADPSSIAGLFPDLAVVPEVVPDPDQWLIRAYYASSVNQSNINVAASVLSTPNVEILQTGPEVSSAGGFDVLTTYGYRSIDDGIAAQAIRDSVPADFPLGTIWEDDISSYAEGGIHDQGVWKGWYGDPAADATVVADPAGGGSNVLQLETTSDIVAELNSLNAYGGQMTLSMEVYVPGDHTGEAHVLLENQYNYGGQTNASIQVVFTGVDPVESRINGPVTAPQVLDSWVELRIEMDIDGNLVDVYYDGALLHDDAPYLGGARAFAAIDLWSNGSSAIYFRNFVLERTGAPDSALAAPNSEAREDRSVINFWNSGGDASLRGRGNSPFPGEMTADDNNIWTCATATLTVTEEDDYTFATYADDQTRVIIPGTSGWSLWGIASGNNNGADNGFNVGGCCNDAGGTVHLTPGDYDIQFYFYEGGGGAYTALYVAKGAFTSLTQDFKLLGAPDAVVETNPHVEELRPVFNMNDGCVDGVAGDAGFIGGDDCLVGDDLSPQGQANGDDNHVVYYGKKILSVSEAGTYTLGFRSDDGAMMVVDRVDDGDAPQFVSSAGAGLAAGNKLVFPTDTGNSQTYGVIDLEAGDYCIQFVYFEIGGGNNGEVFWARGEHTAYNPDDFRLIGEALPTDGVGPFIRGDCNGDGAVTGQVTDAAFLFAYNFTGGTVPPCFAACDANMDGAFVGAVTDGVYILQFNFLGGPPPPAPFPGCGTSDDPGDVALGCETPTAACP